MLHTLLMIIHFFCAAAIVALVLLQRGKCPEAGAGLGAGASGTVFGARGASTALSRATAILAAVFMITSLSLAYVGARKSNAPASTLLDQLATPTTPVKPATGPTGASSGAAGAASGIAGAEGGAGAGAAPAAPTTSAPTGAPAPGTAATN